MKRDKYFLIVLLSGILFLVCLVIYLRKGQSGNLPENTATTIDFGALAEAEETVQDIE